MRAIITGFNGNLKTNGSTPQVIAVMDALSRERRRL
jgi:hypothetical protein